MEDRKNKHASSKWYLVEYIDAAYLYCDQIQKMNGVIVAPPLLRTISYKIDYAPNCLVLNSGSEKQEYRYVIPKGLIKNIIEIKCDMHGDCTLGNEVTADTFALPSFTIESMGDILLGQKISIAWNDVRLSDPTSTISIPTPMRMEGFYAGYFADFLYISNPNNVNVEKGISHPQQKADLYAVPVDVISKLDLIDTQVTEIPTYQFKAMDQSYVSKIKMINDVVGFIENDTGNLFATMNGSACIDAI